MVDFTTEQQVPFSFQVMDGRGRVVAVDGTPVAASSDETVATVSLVAGSAANSWDGMVVAVAPGSGRITVTADADLGSGIQDVVGVLDINVTLDDRTGARIVNIQAGTPEDKPV